LTEKNLDFSLQTEIFWKKSPEFLRLNPLGEIPVFIDLTGGIISGSQAVCEFLEESHKDHSCLTGDVWQRAEIRRICSWFDGKFAKEVTLPLLYEKHIKRCIVRDCSQQNDLNLQTHLFGPNSNMIRLAKNIISNHLDYLSWLLERRNWAAGSHFSLADITIASHLSVVDYFSDVPWEKFLILKEWYMKIKSRSSFRAFFSDRIPGLQAPKHYYDLDF
jgi:glutathione S-transferase